MCLFLSFKEIYGKENSETGDQGWPEWLNQHFGTQSFLLPLLQTLSSL